MKKDKIVLEELEKDLIRKEKPDFQKNIQMFEIFLEHARLMKAIPLKNPMEGIEVDFKIAKILKGLK